jgi:hypothetical protein
MTTVGSVGLFLLAALIQYALVAHVLADLRERDRVLRHGKVTWGLLVLCLPFVGAVLYVVYAIDGPPPPRRPIWEQGTAPRRFSDILRFGGKPPVAPAFDDANWGAELEWEDEFVIDEPPPEYDYLRD